MPQVILARRQLEDRKHNVPFRQIVKLRMALFQTFGWRAGSGWVVVQAGTYRLPARVLPRTPPVDAIEQVRIGEGQCAPAGTRTDGNAVANRSRAGQGKLSTHWRVGTSGMTWSTRWAEVSNIRLESL